MDALPLTLGSIVHETIEGCEGVHTGKKFI
jgi:hypothetical protein